MNASNPYNVVVQVPPVPSLFHEVREGRKRRSEYNTLKFFICLMQLFTKKFYCIYLSICAMWCDVRCVKVIIMLYVSGGVWREGSEGASKQCGVRSHSRQYLTAGQTTSPLPSSPPSLSSQCQHSTQAQNNRENNGREHLFHWQCSAHIN